MPRTGKVSFHLVTPEGQGELPATPRPQQRRPCFNGRTRMVAAKPWRRRGGRDPCARRPGRRFAIEHGVPKHSVVPVRRIRRRCWRAPRAFHLYRCGRNRPGAAGANGPHRPKSKQPARIKAQASCIPLIAAESKPHLRRGRCSQTTTRPNIPVSRRRRSPRRHVWS